VDINRYPWLFIYISGYPWISIPKLSQSDPHRAHTDPKVVPIWFQKFQGNPMDTNGEPNLLFFKFVMPCPIPASQSSNLALTTWVMGMSCPRWCCSFAILLGPVGLLEPPQPTPPPPPKTTKQMSRIGFGGFWQYGNVRDDRARLFGPRVHGIWSRKITRS